MLTFTFFAYQILHIVGKVIILRGAPQSNQSRTLICLSEDDGSALVWNTLTQNSESVKPDNTRKLQKQNQTILNFSDKEIIIFANLIAHFLSLQASNTLLNIKIMLMLIKHSFVK